MNDVELWLISGLRPSEGVCDISVAELTDRIRNEGVWTHPVPVCEQTGLVMDGNHRLKAAERLGLQWVPVIPLSYFGGRVVVRDRKDGGLFDLSRLLPVVHTGTLLPYKTTEHEFEPALPVISIRLNSLLNRSQIQFAPVSMLANRRLLQTARPERVNFKERPLAAVSDAPSRAPPTRPGESVRRPRWSFAN